MRASRGLRRLPPASALQRQGVQHLADLDLPVEGDGFRMAILRQESAAGYVSLTRERRSIAMSARQPPRTFVRETA
jgi:hypothetical protein